MNNLPSQYEWLEKLKHPRMIVEGVLLYGTYEFQGDSDNRVILEWAKEAGIKEYAHDSVPWCGLFMAICAKRSGWQIPEKPLWALNWQKFGQAAIEPMLGDVMVFKRSVGHGKTAGHVAMYVGEDATHWHILGGNQADKVSIVRRSKAGWFKARRPIWKTAQPREVRRVILSSTGLPVSERED